MLILRLIDTWDDIGAFQRMMQRKRRLWEARLADLHKTGDEDTMRAWTVMTTPFPLDPTDALCAALEACSRGEMDLVLWQALDVLPASSLAHVWATLDAHPPQGGGSLMVLTAREDIRDAVLARVQP